MLIFCQRHRLSETLVSNLSARPIAVSEWLIRQTRMITVDGSHHLPAVSPRFTRFALEVVLMNKIIKSCNQSTVEIDFPFVGKFVFVEITSRDKRLLFDQVTVF